MGIDRLRLDTTPQALVEEVKLEPYADGPGVDYPAYHRTTLFLHVIHDGNWLPAEFLVDRDGKEITLDELDPDYVRERDWGAGAFAARLAAKLGLDVYHRVNVARVLMDFGRFPGSTPRLADHLHRFAINYPFSKRLSYQQKKVVLERYYDRISDRMDRLLQGRMIKLAIHTYDQYNDSGTERPPVSLMTRSIGYQIESEMPQGLFDPLYPDVLAEFTADRVLRDRISLTLEKAGVPVAHNYPYCLPEGSLEVRYQVWAYFAYVREQFERKFPETAENPAFQMVWRMLTDTNLRSSESESLRSYLHMFRRPPPSQEAEFRAAGQAYEHIYDFANGHGRGVLEEYRFSPRRASSLGLEVRKDVVCDLDERGWPRALRQDHIEKISALIAEAMATYLREDREHETKPSEDLERHDPWYMPPRD